ncbi:hypothetical protein L1987_53165 [Smallanthus sonchifolius]|uniref:Uncharacterized protein n=1 Tax=Smallanthus sonchifolius TaxID=185202 RepID=A0ACB9EV38_9ASTR|nr:hypothetical protein L1987_53165 [Smallanthus sonchifolius]
MESIEPFTKNQIERGRISEEVEERDILALPLLSHFVSISRCPAAQGFSIGYFQLCLAFKILQAVEVVDVDQQNQMVSELNGSMMKCLRNQNEGFGAL